MAFLILVPDFRTPAWEKEFKRLDPDLDLRIWPEVGDPDDVTFVLSWKHPEGEFLKFKNLKCIASMGVGTDHVFRDSRLPKDIPVTRIMDPFMAQCMSEYVMLGVLAYIRRYDDFRKLQAAGKWAPKRQRLAEKEQVGIMGMGRLGTDVATKLTVMGFNVSGWSRTPKTLPGVVSYAGNEQLKGFLSGATILVCLLPLTPATRNILNRDLFFSLPKGAYVINAARGAHMVEADLLEALEAGHLSGAFLDVFQTEPLPENHPFWRHPAVSVTPHIAAVTHPKKAAPQIYDNYRRVMAGKPPLHQVDPEKGY